MSTVDPYRADGDGAASAGSKTPVLDKTLADLITESQALRSDVHHAEAARKKATTINLAVLGLLVLFVGMLVAVVWQNNQLAHEIAKTNKTMSDCTTPGGECYENSRQRTGSAINDIIRAELFMAECSRLYPGESGPEFDRKLEACVYQRLAGPKLRPSPAPAPAPTPSPTKK